MTEIRFYHLQNGSQEQVLPMLLNKILERGHRMVVKLANDVDVDKMNNHLWSFDANSFIAHGSKKNGNADMQPIWLTSNDENPNEADVLILCQDVVSEMQSDFKICCEVFNGNDSEVVSKARMRWKAYKEKGFEVTYWKQTEVGGWEKVV